jgi:CheY-like chemotaxis protein
VIQFKDPKFCKSILDIAQAYGPYSFWTENLEPGMNPDTTWRALMVVAAFKDSVYAEPSRALLKAYDSWVRAWACTALAILNYRPAFSEILERINDHSNRVRYHARQAAASMQGEESGERYIHHHQSRDQFQHILISDDDPSFAMSIQKLVNKMGFQVEFAPSAEKTTELALRVKPQVIITDNQKNNDNLSGLNMTWDLCRLNMMRETVIFMVTVDFVEPIFIWSGGDAYFNKLIGLAMLGRTIEDYLYN